MRWTRSWSASGHCFARYADDCNVYVGSLRAGKRVMAVLRKLYAKLHLRVNEAKSTVASVFGRKFLGLQLLGGQGCSGQTQGGQQALSHLQAAHQATNAPLRWAQRARSG